MLHLRAWVWTCACRCVRAHARHGRGWYCHAARVKGRRLRQGPERPALPASVQLRVPCRLASRHLPAGVRQQLRLEVLLAKLPAELLDPPCLAWLCSMCCAPQPPALVAREGQPETSRDKIYYAAGPVDNSEFSEHAEIRDRRAGPANEFALNAVGCLRVSDPLSQ